MNTISAFLHWLFLTPYCEMTLLNGLAAAGIMFIFMLPFYLIASRRP